MIIDLNGTLSDAGDARIDPADRGFTLGDGLFETIRVTGSKPRRLDAHCARLRSGADALGIPIPVTDADIAKRIEALLKANDLTDAAIRLTLSRGPAPRGLLPPDPAQPTMILTAGLLPTPGMPVRAIVSAETRRNEHSPLARIKSLNYLDNVIARREAARYGVDEAILLNTTGRIAETTIANIFILIGGALLTPPVADGALPGVLRAELLNRFRGEEQSLSLEDFNRAEEVFLTNALGVRPLIEISGQPVGDGQPGLITQMLAARL